MAVCGGCCDGRISSPEVLYKMLKLYSLLKELSNYLNSHTRLPIQLLPYLPWLP